MPPAKSPLSRHATGQWYRRHKGRNYYFGTDQDAALRRYLAEWPAIVAGIPRIEAGDHGSLTVADLCNRFLHAKRQRVDSGELTAEVWGHYRRMTMRVLGVLGRTRQVVTLQPGDFGRVRADAAMSMAPTTLTTFLKHARAMFTFGADLTDRPARYGGQFDLPTAKTIRIHRESQPRKLLDADTLRKLLAAADPILKAQILLGLNCGFGATDLSELRTRHLDRPGWVVLPRRKTGVGRRCPLWPETLAALEAARPHRPKPADPADGDRVFLSHTGLPVKRFRERTASGAGSRGDAVGAAWEKLCKREGVKAAGSFYILKHVFITEASNARDDVAVDQITGHARNDIRSAYVERIEDQRLEAIADHMRRWLWPKK